MGVPISDLIHSKGISLEDLAGKKLAVDAFNLLYFFLSVIRHRTTGEPLRDRHGNVTSHLSGLLHRTARFLEAGIQPVYVFDGPFPQFKKQTVEKRRAQRKEAERNWKNAVRRGKPALKYAQAATAVDVDILASAKELLDLMGVPWIQAPSEGEAQCAWMCRQGLVYATASQDFDSLLFGSPRLVRSLSAVSRQELLGQAVSAEVDPDLIELDELLESLGITWEQLVLVGLLVGTDYNQGVPGVGPKGAVHLVKTHQTLENLRAVIRFAGKADIRKLYEFFLNPPHTKEFQMAWKPAAIGPLRNFLVGQRDFSPERVELPLQRLQVALQAG